MDGIEDALTGSGWHQIVDRLSDGRDLDEWARSSGALVRSRAIKDGESLLRLALVYGGCGRSLKQSCLWAASQGLADLSDEALLKRLSKAAPWLEAIVGSLLNGPRVAPEALSAGRRLRLIDGTTISAPGSGKPTWRLLATFDVQRQVTTALSLVPANVGESLSAAPLRSGDLVIGDRGFARPHGLRAVCTQGADFLIRLGSRSVRLLDQTGQPLDMPALLALARAHGGLDRAVQVGHSRQTGWRPLAARLVMRPLPEAMARAARGKLTRAAQREGYTPSTTAYGAADWLIVLTSLPEAAFPADSVAELYRLRWQIELLFKRLKSLAHLDRLPARNPALAQTWLYANLIVALLAEDLAGQVLDSPPSGPGGQATGGLSVAPLG